MTMTVPPGFCDSVPAEFFEEPGKLRRIWKYRILPNTRASPNRRAPPPKVLDHVPEDSSPKIYMTTLFDDRLNAVLTIVCCIP